VLEDIAEAQWIPIATARNYPKILDSKLAAVAKAEGVEQEIANVGFVDLAHFGG